MTHNDISGLPKEPAFYRPTTLGVFEFGPTGGRGGWGWCCTMCGRSGGSYSWFAALTHPGQALTHAGSLKHLRNLQKRKRRQRVVTGS